VKHAELVVNTNIIYFADGEENLRRECELSGEPMLLTMCPTGIVLDDPEAVPYEKASIKHFGHLTTYELWQVHKKKRELRKEYLDAWHGSVGETGTGRPIDAIICPASPYPAPPHGSNRNAWYTALWNALDYTVAVLPVTTVNPDLDIQHPPHEFRNYEDKWIYDTFDPILNKGCPVGLQVVGQRQEEEATIAIAEIVDNALKAFVEAK